MKARVTELELQLNNKDAELVQEKKKLEEFKTNAHVRVEKLKELCGQWKAKSEALKMEVGNKDSQIKQLQSDLEALNSSKSGDLQSTDNAEILRLRVKINELEKALEQKNEELIKYRESTKIALQRSRDLLPKYRVLVVDLAAAKKQLEKYEGKTDDQTQSIITDDGVLSPDQKAENLQEKNMSDTISTKSPVFTPTQAPTFSFSTTPTTESTPSNIVTPSTTTQTGFGRPNNAFSSGFGAQRPTPNPFSNFKPQSSLPFGSNSAISTGTGFGMGLAKSEGNGEEGESPSHSVGDVILPGLQPPTTTSLSAVIEAQGETSGKMDGEFKVPDPKRVKK